VDRQSSVIRGEMGIYFHHPCSSNCNTGQRHDESIYYVTWDNCPGVYGHPPHPAPAAF